MVLCVKLPYAHYGIYATLSKRHHTRTQNCLYIFRNKNIHTWGKVELEKKFVFFLYNWKPGNSVYSSGGLWLVGFVQDYNWNFWNNNDKTIRMFNQARRMCSKTVLSQKICWELLEFGYILIVSNELRP